MPQAYDHRLREPICETKDIELAVRLGVPASTALSWLRRGSRQVVSSFVFRLVAFCVEQNNAVMPDSRCHGHTPDEMYLGTKPDLADELAERRRQARAARIASNQRRECSDCQTAAGQPPS